MKEGSTGSHSEQELEKLADEIELLKKEVEYYKKHYMAAIQQRDSLMEYAQIMKEAKEDLEEAKFWKMTKPLRQLSDIYKKMRGIYSDSGDEQYKDFSWRISESDRKAQESRYFPGNISFSILVPLYNTDKKYLEEMISSVRQQTYQKWQLCLVDGSDLKHSYIQKICERFSREDKRICYKKIKENKGISENTNMAAALATGEYFCFLDHDDWLHPSALYQCAAAIYEKDADMTYTDEGTFRLSPRDMYQPHYKPDFSPDTLRSYNYICHFLTIKRTLFEQVGGFRKEFDGSQDYDMILRITEIAKKIEHIPQLLYYWRAHEESVASSLEAKPYVLNAGKMALKSHLERINLMGEAEFSTVPSTYRIRYEIKGSPLISILIPNKDQKNALRSCIDTLQEKSTYQNYEIIVIENNSTEAETFQYYESLKQSSKIRVITWEGPFNYSAINNYGATFARGEYLLLLNNDIEIISPDWMQEMLMFAQREDVGAVGAKLYYPDDTIQHAGVILGIGGIAGHSHKYYDRLDVGYAYRLTLAQNLSAVTAACLMVPLSVYNQVGGLDEGYAVAFNDVDFCLKIRQAGYLIVFTPYAEAYHHESKSRGKDDTQEKQARAIKEIRKFQERWKKELEKGDCYYNPNLTLESEDFSVHRKEYKF